MALQNVNDGNDSRPVIDLIGSITAGREDMFFNDAAMAFSASTVKINNNTITVLPDAYDIVAGEMSMLSAAKKELEISRGYVSRWNNEDFDYNESDTSKADGEEGSSDTTASGNLPIEEITISPKTTQGYVVNSGIYMNNKTSYSVDIPSLLNAKIPFVYKKSEPQVLVIHTHGTEAFTDEQKTTYSPDDTNRSQDNTKNIIMVGNALTDALEANGIGVIHDTALHDIPSFNGSYKNAEESINKYLKQYPSIQAVIDIHRDALITADGVKYAPVTTYAGEKYAQVMLVMGSDEGGLLHKDWQQNLKLAFKVQKTLNETIPDLARPLNLRKERFNQHATNNSMLIEVGACGNTLNEAINSAKVLGKVISSILKNGK